MSNESGSGQAGASGQTPEQGTQGQAQSQPAATQSGAPAEGTQQQGGSQEQAPQFLTRADAEAMVQEALNQARSYADKGRVRAEKAAQEAKSMVEQMRSLGQNISDEDADKVIQAAKLKAIETQGADEDEQETPAATGPMTPAQAQEVQYFVENNLGAHDLKMQGKYGIELDPSDPEVKDFKLTGERAQDETNIEKMYQAKKDRLAASAQDNNNQTNNAEGTGQVRVPTQGGVTPQVIADSASDYWKNAHQ